MGAGLAEFEVEFFIDVGRVEDSEKLIELNGGEFSEFRSDERYGCAIGVDLILKDGYKKSH